MKSTHPWKRGFNKTPPTDGAQQIHSLLAQIGFHRYRLNINQSLVAELLTVRFKKKAVGHLNTEQLKSFLAEIEKAQSIEDL